VRHSILSILQGVVTRTRNVSEYMLVLALCLVGFIGQCFYFTLHIKVQKKFFVHFIDCTIQMPLAVVHLDDQSSINDNSCIIEYDCKEY